MLARAERVAPGFDRGVAEAALQGLLAIRKTLPPKLFYDDEGCRLFGEITRLPEYYPTRTELALLRETAPEFGDGVPPGSALIEYGGSDETKAAILLDACPGFTAYVPIDVAAGALDALARRLHRSHPDLAVHPVVGDFLERIRLPGAIADLKRTGFFPGSTIGNLDPAQAGRFLSAARHTLGSDAHFLVGVDLRKDASVLVPAYDDAQGVTADFNRNVLRVVNRELGADFDPDAFDHVALWDAEREWIEMRLRSASAQSVRVAGLDLTVEFAAGEEMRTEVSAKFREEGVRAELAAAGLAMRSWWTDPDGQFGLSLSVLA